MKSQNQVYFTYNNFQWTILKVLINWRDIKDTEKILWQNQNLVHSSFFHFVSTAAPKWGKVEETFEKWSPVLFVLFSVQLGGQTSFETKLIPSTFLQYCFFCDWLPVLKIWSCKLWLWQKYKLVVRLAPSILVQSWNFVFGIIADNNSALYFL